MEPAWDKQHQISQGDNLLTFIDGVSMIISRLGFGWLVVRMHTL